MTLADSQDAALNSYLTFTMNNEYFAVSVAKVTELLEMLPVTHVPRSPEFMRGVINLRGAVVPVIDTRLKFCLPSVPDTIDTCVVVSYAIFPISLHVHVNNNNKTLHLLHLSFSCLPISRDFIQALVTFLSTLSLPLSSFYTPPLSLQLTLSAHFPFHHYLHHSLTLSTLAG